ncbi:MAG: hypothetical protein OK455_04490 [Thaumarchaeota archaeon]|nr:hypothetical protein [Nitrososphaerota archaeon]
MEILEGETLYRTLLQRYSRNPEGWSFTISRSASNGFFDAFVGAPDDSWHLKLDTIFKPSPFVLGAKVEVDQSKVRPLSPLSFGFRKIRPSEAPALQDDSPEGMRRLLAILSSSRPVVPSNSGSYVQGPFVFTNHGAMGAMNGDQEKVDQKLSQELLKLVRQRYPSYL